MALIKCPECGKDISDKSKTCINCGYPIYEYASELQTEEQYVSEQIKENQGKEKTFSSEIKKTNYVVEKTPFWKRWWFLALMCIFIPPVGIVFLWIAKKPKYTPIRTTLTAFLAIYAFMWCIVVFYDSDGSTSVDENTAIEREVEEKPQNNIEEKDNEENAGIGGEKEKYEIGIKKYNSGKYLYVSADDLKKYYANMDGAKIYCVIEIDDITDDGVIQSNLTDGYMFSNFTAKEKYDIEVGKTVAILGKINGYSDYGIAGNSIEFTDCYIFADGDEAKKYGKEKSDEKLQKYFVATQEVAESGGDISEEEYKGFCEELDYTKILRNPDDYKNKYCKINGTVAQIIDGILGTITIYVEDSNGNKWECYYSYDDGETHLLDGDKVILYGKCKGTETATTILGEQKTLPSVGIEYLEIK